jgi:hypothetical protein
MIRVILIILVFLLATAQALTAATAKLLKSHSPASALSHDYSVTLNVNDLEMFVSNLGAFAYDALWYYGKADGLYYPRGTTKTCVYAAGIWVGAKVSGQIRVAVSDYATEFSPGPMASGTFQSDRETFRVYKIRKGDDGQTNPDWRDWPVSQGAPVDTQCKPQLLGDQMTWSVCNDANSLSHTNNAGGTQPLGVEIQQSAFAFATGGAIGKTIFVKFRIINNGGQVLDSTFVSIWVDPDIGDASDDLVGCDTLLSLGYCYNSGEDAVYGIAPPAVGLALLQGPMVLGSSTDTGIVSGVKYPGYRNLPLSSFNRYLNGFDPMNPGETYNCMRGLNKDGTPMVNPVTHQVTRFATSGDPVTGIGWLDPTAADKRMMMDVGPFRMLPGDTQEVVAAILIGQGTDAYSSVQALRQNQSAACEAYRMNFGVTGQVIHGDLDGDGSMSLTDVVLLVNYIFANGPAPVLGKSADVNCDDAINIADAVVLINYIFLGRPAPCAQGN